MEFEWDENKNAINKQKHGVGFETAQTLFQTYHLVLPDLRKLYPEERFIAIGEIEGVVILVVVYTPRRGRIRIISARKASRSEREKYHECQPKK